MKRSHAICFLLTALLLALGFQTARAQVPARISYQGLLLDQDKALLADGDHQVTFRLYDQLEGGEALWSETQTVALEDGLLATMIGAREALELSFDRPYFLSVQLDDQSESRRVALAASAYALMARDVPDGTVVRSISGLRDAVELVAGDGIAIRRQDNRLVISASGSARSLVDYGPPEVNSPAKNERGFLTEEEDEQRLAELLATLGAGGSNTGLDLAYDAGRIITLDDGQILLEGPGSGVGLQVHNSDMVFRNSTGSNAAFRFAVDGTSPVQTWRMEIVGPTGAFRLVNATTGNKRPLTIFKNAQNNLVTLAGTALIMRNTAGVAKVTIDTDVSGDGRVTTQELEITGGSDLSETFDVSGNFGVPVAAPGMVVSIDPTHPGALTLSGRAYDRMVAGVVSGAGGIETGLLMGQKGSVADGAVPVALTGRVYVWVDAGHGAVQPGDLLTSSSTPGHAMKVTDYGRSQGAILGKAMTGLAEGQGLVLMLVSLQ